MAVDGLNRLLVTIYLCRLHKPSAGSLKKSVANNKMNVFFFLSFKVEINEKATRQLFVINSGKFNFDFSWEIHNRTKLKGLRVLDGEKLASVTPESGTVPCNTRKRCQLAFCPPGRLSLTGCDLLLKVLVIHFWQFVERHVVNVGLLLAGDIAVSSLPLN